MALIPGWVEVTDLDHYVSTLNGGTEYTCENFCQDQDMGTCGKNCRPAQIDQQRGGAATFGYHYMLAYCNDNFAPTDLIPGVENSLSDYHYSGQIILLGGNHNSGDYDETHYLYYINQAIELCDAPTNYQSSYFPTFIPYKHPVPDNGPYCTTPIGSGAQRVGGYTFDWEGVDRDILHIAIYIPYNANPTSAIIPIITITLIIIHIPLH